jgi:hypothetical protein
VVATRPPTKRRGDPRNLAPAATAHASNEPVPVQYWIRALNDGVVRANPLPPEMWGSWTPHNPPRQWIEYRWRSPVAIDESRLWFWADHPAGAGEGVAPPKSWSLEYWDGTHWRAVTHPRGFGVEPGAFQSAKFDAVWTTCLRATLEASGAGDAHAALAVQEWQALAAAHPPRRSAAPATTCD